MDIVFMGTPDFAEQSLRARLEQGFSVKAVYTQTDKPVGRKRVLTPPPVKVLAQRHGIPVYQPKSLRRPEVIEELRALAPDLIVVVAYGKILPKELSLIHISPARWRGRPSCSALAVRGGGDVFPRRL